MLQFVHHVNYVVRNCDEVVAYFDRNFGMKPEKVFTREDGSMKEAVFKVGQAEIQVTEPIDPTTGIAKHLARHGPGVYHVAWKIDGAKKTARTLEDRGVKLRKPGQLEESPHGYYAINIDPASSHDLWFQLIGDK